MSYLHQVPLQFLAGSSAPLQFPDCITCYPPVLRLYHVLTPVPRLHHVLSSSSLAVSRAPLQFPDCITCYARVHKMYYAPPPPPLAYTWIGKLSLFIPFVTVIDFTLSTDISA